MATRAELRSRRGRLTIQAGAGAGVAAEQLAGALPDAQIERDVMRAGVERLYENALTAAAGAFVTAAILWVVFWHHTHAMVVLGWALLIHLTQGVRLGVLLAFRHTRQRHREPAVWMLRYRATLTITAAAWGLAPLLFLPAGDLAYAALMLLVMLAMAVTGISGIASITSSINAA